MQLRQHFRERIVKQKKTLKNENLRTFACLHLHIHTLPSSQSIIGYLWVTMEKGVAGNM